MWLVQLPSDTSTSPQINVSPIGIDGSSTVDWVVLVHKLIALLFVAGGFFALLFLLWGGILYITSGGKEEKIQKATHTLRNAIIGILIIILSFTIISIVGKILGRELLPYLNFQTIVDMVNSFSGNL